MDERTTPEQGADVLELAGVPLRADAVKRVAKAIGPTCEAFAPIEAALPFDVEPSNFVRIQQGAAIP
jgi:hypothetical protein